MVPVSGMSANAPDENPAPPLGGSPTCGGPITEAPPVTVGYKPARAACRTRAGFPELRLGSGDGLIRNVDLFFKLAQLGVLKDLPPLAFLQLVARLADLPVLLLEIRRQLFPIGVSGQERTASHT